MKTFTFDIPGATLNFYASRETEVSPSVLALQIVPKTPHMETMVRRTMKDGKGIVFSIPGEIAVNLLMPIVTECCAEIAGIEIPEPPTSSSTPEPSSSLLQ